MIVKFGINDTLVMKNKHPCGSDRMLVLYAASDVKLKCLGCGHEMMVAREKIEKIIKKVISPENE